MKVQKVTMSKNEHNPSITLLMVVNDPGAELPGIRYKKDSLRFPSPHPSPQRGEGKGEGADSGDKKCYATFSPAAKLFSFPEQSSRVFNSIFYKIAAST